MQGKPTKRYWQAYRALYGKNLTDEEAKNLTKPRKKRKNDEEVEQIKFITWLEKVNVHCYHPRNGGSLNALEGAKFKRMGVRRGVPDLCIPYARKAYHGLYIELKRVDGKLSDLSVEQKWWLDFLGRQGYLALVSFGSEQGKKIVQDYFAP